MNLKITLVISNMTFGGAQRVMSIMANHWASRGMVVRLLSLRDDEAPFFDLNKGVDYRALNYAWGARGLLPSGLVFLINLVKLRGTILEGKPDIVISFLDETNVRVLLAMTGSSVPVVVSERNDPAGRKLRPLWTTLRNLSYRHARALVAQTERMAAHFRPLLGNRVFVIPNPVPNPVPNLIPTPTAAKHSGAQETSGRVILSAGKLHAQKGFDLLLRAFASLVPAYPDWRLVILGEGAERRALESLAHALGIAIRVSLPGRSGNPAEAMRDADLYVSSSRYEGFPNALCEAMACGLPVVATDCPTGPREIITHGEDGILVRNEDVAALAAAMRDLMEDEAKRRRLGAKAAGITERFSVESVMRQWDEFLHVPSVFAG